MYGRPRDPALDAAIRKAALEIVTEHGYGRMTMEGVAARSGVSKQALYRRYASKGELLLAAVDSFAREALPAPDTGNLRDDLLPLVQTVFAVHRSSDSAFSQAVAAESAQGPDFARRAVESVINPRREIFGEVFRRARERGEITCPDDDVLVDLIYGPMWYALLFGIERLTDDYAESLTDAVIAAARPA
ncbi:TetR/AcrR family transcriptional regulator [Streptomyces violens]|uniref:TetR/AcrR family transcriptional regulator n=1 Tax=Streptomyces violens TaxID=66377 RepID=UPI0007C70098|nr:TetR/AcrR family transcriptional regulator [Streptomyces violens]